MTLVGLVECVFFVGGPGAFGWGFLLLHLWLQWVLKRQLMGAQRDVASLAFVECRLQVSVGESEFVVELFDDFLYVITV